MKLNYILVLTTVFFWNCSDKEVILNPSPEKFDLVFPVHGQTDVDTSIQFEWEANEINQEIEYTFYLGETEEELLPITQNLKENVYVLDSILGIQSQYFWKVEAKDSYEQITTSNIQTFTTRPLNPASLVASVVPYNPENNFKVISFNDKMWIFQDAIWTSADGENWEEVIPNDGFTAQASSEYVVYNDKIWRIDGTQMDVWNTTNGVEWEEVTSSANFTPIVRSATMYQGKLWVMVSNQLDQSVREYNNELWFSSNGLDWQMGYSFIDSNSFEKIVSFRGELHMINDSAGSGSLNQYIKSSSNGLDWSDGILVELDVNFRSNVVLFGNRIWIPCFKRNRLDLSGDRLLKMISSRDGKYWEDLTLQVSRGLVKYRDGQRLLKHSNKLYSFSDEIYYTY